MLIYLISYVSIILSLERLNSEIQYYFKGDNNRREMA